jgi:glycine oxidase
VVVGAGIVGLACAWRIAQQGASVLIVDRDAPGAGASGVAAGMLAPVTEADFGERRLLELNLRAASLWPDFAKELESASDAGVGYLACGAVAAAADRDDVEELRRLHELQRSLSLGSEWLSGSECRRLEPSLSPRVPGGIHAPHEAHVDPSEALRALEVAAEREGAELAAGVAVTGLEPRHGALALKTSAGSLEAESVVVASGAWSGELDLAGADRLPVRPLKGQILRLRGERSLTRRIVRTPRCYILDRGDGRVVIGATMEERGFDVRVTADGVYRLLEAAWEVVPDVGELELVDARAGLRPATPDNLPLVGSGSLEGLIVATGHGRNGVLQAPLSADAVAALVAGDVADGVDGCEPGRFAGSEAAPGFAPQGARA